MMSLIEHGGNQLPAMLCDGQCDSRADLHQEGGEEGDIPVAPDPCRPTEDFGEGSEDEGAVDDPVLGSIGLEAVKKPREREEGHKGDTPTQRGRVAVVGSIGVLVGHFRLGKVCDSDG